MMDDSSVYESFGIRIYKEYFNFASAHFLIFEDGTREELHGHNYQVQMALEGYLTGQQDVFIDFLHIKPIIKAVCDSIDHRTLLPRDNANLRIADLGGELEVFFQERDRWIFPKRDVVVLPITNTSAERLAQFLCVQVLTALCDQYPQASIRRVEMTVEESRGQAAIYRQEYGDPKLLCDIIRTQFQKQPV